MNQQGQRGRGTPWLPQKSSGARLGTPAAPPGRNAKQRRRKKEQKADEEVANPNHDPDPSSAAAAFFATVINRTVRSNTTNQHQETDERNVNTTAPFPLINRGINSPVPPTGTGNFATPTNRIINLSSNPRQPGTTAHTAATATDSFASLKIASLDINKPNTVPTLKSLTLGEEAMEKYALTFGGITYDLGRDMPIERMTELIEEEWTFNEALLRSLGRGDKKAN